MYQLPNFSTGTILHHENADPSAAMPSRDFDEAAHVEERLDAVRRFIDWWHGPSVSNQGIPAAELHGLQLPRPLRWWYELVGRRKGIADRQNEILPPERLRIRGDLLAFYVENQGNCYWGTSPRGEDPPVFWCEEDTAGRVHRVREAEKLSGFLLQVCLFEAVMAAPFGACTQVDGEDLAAVLRSLQPTGLGPWAWLGLRFFSRGEVLAFADSESWIWLGALSADPLRFLRDFNIHWERDDF